MKLISGDGTVYTLDKPQLELGRSPRNDIVIADGRVSGRHALISMDGDAVILSDVGSSNGTFVNNMRLSEPIRLMDGDEIRVGDTRLTVVDDSARQSDVARTQLDFHPEPALPDAPAPWPTPPAVPTPPAMPAPPPARPVTAAPQKPASRQWIVWAVVGLAAVCVVGIGVAVVGMQAVQTQQLNATNTAIAEARASQTAAANKAATARYEATKTQIANMTATSRALTATAIAENRRATETTRTTMLDDLAAICRSGARGNLFASYTGGSGLHPIALIAQEDGAIHEWNTRLPADWTNDDWTQTQLAGCISIEWVTVETCNYSGFTKLFRDQQRLTLNLVSAQTGSSIASDNFWGAPPEQCLSTELFTTFSGITMNKTKQGDPVAFNDVKVWLEYYVAR